MTLSELRTCTVKSVRNYTCIIVGGSTWGPSIHVFHKIMGGDKFQVKSVTEVYGSTLLALRGGG